MSIRIRSLPAVLSKRTAGVVAAAGALLVAGIPGTTAASAAVAHPDSATDTYDCGGSLPEVCVGIIHNGDFVDYEQVQVDLSYYSSEVHYYYSSAFGTHHRGSSFPAHGGPGWVSPRQWDWSYPYHPDDVFCGFASMPDHGQYASACVSLP